MHPSGPGSQAARRAADAQRNVHANLGKRAEELVGHMKQGGFTYDPRNDRHVSQGFAVSKGGEQRQGGEARAADIVGFHGPRAPLYAQDKSAMVGGWRTTLPQSDAPDDVHDTSYVYPSMEQAQRTGRQHGEEAVFDLGTFDETPVDYGTMTAFGGARPYEVVREENSVIAAHIEGMGLE